MAYWATEDDEVEDLYLLLAYAKSKFPELEAVSSGAIASDYQRIRVEHVRYFPLWSGQTCRQQSSIPMLAMA